MHTPSNLPSSSVRIPHRENMTRFQTSAPAMRFPAKLKQTVSPTSRTALQSFICLAVEPEDAKITGATRSLSRRLLALNMPYAS